MFVGISMQSAMYGGCLVIADFNGKGEPDVLK